MISILFEIEFRGGMQFFSLNSPELSSYPEEKEVLLQDGILYKVVNVR